MDRPILEKGLSSEEFRSYYWLKEELLAFCRKEGIRQKGNKIELAERISHFLQTGEKDLPEARPVLKPSSPFNWKTESLGLETRITDSYKNSQNVRTFFEAQIGPQFRFNIRFMDWMKNNVGKTLADAVEAWKEIAADTRPTEIPPQLEYNTYLRAIHQDNPGMSRKEAIAHWKKKKSKRGDNVYRRSDLEGDTSI